jgi:hypothetical protein
MVHFQERSQVDGRRSVAAKVAKPVHKRSLLWHIGTASRLRNFSSWGVHDEIPDYILLGGVACRAQLRATQTQF